jgi:hypothetical protein
MSDKTDADAAHPSARPDPQAPLNANANGADRTARSVTGPQLATVEVAGGGAVAVTRPRMPRVFRILLALTGVRV